MLGPLSSLRYFLRNPKKTLPVLAVIVLAVFAVSLTAVLTGSMITSARDGWLKPYERYSMVSAVQGLLDAWVVRLLERNPNVGRLVPVLNAYVRITGIFGSDQRLVLGLRESDLAWFLRRTDLTLARGRLPSKGRPEIALHADIMKSKGVRVGDEIGRQVDEDEVLPGRVRVVGVLTGPYPLAVTTYEYMASRAGALPPAGERAYLVFPRPGHQSDLEWDLAGLPRDAVTVTTYAMTRERFEREIVNMDIMIWLLNFVTVFTLSISVGLLNVIFFMQRMAEFGILAAIGYRRSFLLRRTFAEVLLVAAAGWVCGLALSHLVFVGISRFIYEPRGIYLTGIDRRAIAFTLPIPLMIALFSLFIVFWQLWRLDPVSIVERRD